MRIKVTQEDIDNGVTRSSNNCPIALALKSKLNVTRVCVSKREGLGVFNDDGWTWYEASANVKKFINNFDHERVVMPFEFLLKITQTQIV